MDHMRISGTEPSSVILSQTNEFKCNLTDIVTLHGFKVAVYIAFWGPHSVPNDEADHSDLIHLLTVRHLYNSEYFT